jgi:hypothetical protein
MRRLVHAAGNLQSVEINDALVRLLAARPKGAVGENALRLMVEKQRGIFFDRVYGTPDAWKHDPAVLESLLQIARSDDARARKVAYIALEEFAKDPAAVAALRAGTSDPDHDAQYEATMGLYRNPTSPTTRP